MDKKNMIEQPWGYGEQTVYQSAANLLRDELNKKDKLDSEQSKLIEELLKGSIVSVKYDSEAKGYDFVNVDGDVLFTVNLDDIIMSDFVKSSSYDRENGVFTISFENGDKVELDFTVLNNSIDREKQYRKEGDEKLQKLIEQEEEKRDKGDKELRESINWEKQYRKTKDDELLSLIEEEKQSREEGDNALWEVVNTVTSSTEDLTAKLKEEIKSRSDADEEIWKAIDKNDDEQASLNERLDEEIKNRINADEGIRSYFDEEIKSLEVDIEYEKFLRENGDNNILNSLNDLSAYTESEFNKVNVLIEQEADDRLKADEEIWKAIGKSDDKQSSLNDRLEEEIYERKRSNEDLQGKLNNETVERQNAITELENALKVEVISREEKDIELEVKINSEEQTRKYADDALQAAIDRLNSDVNTNIVKIESVEPSSANVLEEYQLTNANGDKLGETIKVYKDSSLKDVKLNEQVLEFTYIKADGSEETVGVDVSKFLAESEFNKGLEVTSDGIVNVKIADNSEEYLTVSEEGVKLTGIDAIKDTSVEGIEEAKTLLGEEKSARETKDTELEGKITNLQGEFTDLQGTLNQEINEREAYDKILKSDLEKLLNDEKERAEKAENDLKTALEEEEHVRYDKDTELEDRLGNIQNNLKEEVEAREAEDVDLHEEINSLTDTVEDISQEIKDFKEEIEGKFENVVGDIEDLDERVTKLESSNGEIEAELEKKANVDDVYTKTEADEKFALKKDIPVDFYTKEEVDKTIKNVNTSIEGVNTSVSALRESARNRDIEERTRATQREDELEKMITQLETHVDSFGNKVETIVAADNTIEVDSSNMLKPAIKVKLASDGLVENKPNNIKLGADGLYSVADLSYDSDNQVLNFVNSAGMTSISGFTDSFVINDLYYDIDPSNNEAKFKLVLKYQTSKINTNTITCKLDELVDSWGVAENGGSGSIILYRDLNENRNRYILTGDVKIQEDSSNALKKEPNTGYLYVKDLEPRLKYLEESLSTLALENLSLKNEIKKLSTSIPKQILDTIKYGEDEFIEE